MQMPARAWTTRRDVAVASFAALAGVAVAVSRSMVGVQGAPLWAELVAQLLGAALLLRPALVGHDGTVVPGAELSGEVAGTAAEQGRQFV